MTTTIQQRFHDLASHLIARSGESADRTERARYAEAARAAANLASLAVNPAAPAEYLDGAYGQLCTEDRAPEWSEISAAATFTVMIQNRIDAARRLSTPQVRHKVSWLERIRAAVLGDVPMAKCGTFLDVSVDDDIANRQCTNCLYS